MTMEVKNVVDILIPTALSGIRIRAKQQPLIAALRMTQNYNYIYNYGTSS